MLKRAHILAVVGLTLPTADAAVALEYCVTCEGPPAMYRCVIKDTEDGPGTDSSVSLYCISQMASRGSHERCGVSRGAPFPCPGLTAIVEQPRDLPARAAAPADAIEPEAAEQVEQPPATEQPAKVPRTVEELAGQTVKTSKEGLKQAGEAIGGTAKKAGEQIGNAGSAIGNAATKTWNCITSLFNACGDEAAEADTPPEEPATN